MSILQEIAGGITAVVAPDLQTVEAQAQQASDQLTLAFEVIIAEGVVIVGLMILQIWILTRATK